MDSSASEKARLVEAVSILPLEDVTGHKQFQLCSYGLEPRGFREIFCERVKGVGICNAGSPKKDGRSRGTDVFTVQEHSVALAQSATSISAIMKFGAGSGEGSFGK